MGDLFLAITVGIISVGIIAAFIILGIMETKLNKKAKSNDDSKKADEPETRKIHVTVVDQRCTVNTVGHKMPKTVKEFYIYFKDDEENSLAIPVPEEYYEAFEKGQIGILTLVDGVFLTFEIDD